MINRKPGWRFPLPCSERRSGGENQARRSLWGRRRRERHCCHFKRSKDDDDDCSERCLVWGEEGRQAEEEGGEGINFRIFCHRTEVPRPALKGEGEVKTRQGGARGEGGRSPHFVKNHCFNWKFWLLSLCSYFDHQELWSEIIHCWLTAE